MGYSCLEKQQTELNYHFYAFRLQHKENGVTSLNYLAQLKKDQLYHDLPVTLTFHQEGPLNFQSSMSKLQNDIPIKL